MTKTAQIQNRINEIISNIPRKWRQYEPAKWQIEALTEAGLIEYMPTNFGHSDAGAVCEEARIGKYENMDTEDGEFDEVWQRQDAQLYFIMSATENENEDEDENEDENEESATIEIEANGEIKYGGIVYRLDNGYYNSAQGAVTYSLLIDGGFVQDDDGTWYEVDGDFTVKIIEVPEERADDVLTITLTAAEIAAAKAYRADYPAEIPA